MENVQESVHLVLICIFGRFLKNVASPQTGVDVVGRRLACELVLALAAQRGSLRYVKISKYNYKVKVIG